MADTVLLSVVVQKLLNTAFSLIAQERSLAGYFKGDLEVAALWLGMIGDLLPDAEGKKGSLAAVQGWLTKLKAVAQFAEGVMDELEYEVLRQRVEKKNTVRDIFSPFKNPLAFRIVMDYKIKDINSSLAEIFKSAYEIGISPVAVTSATDEMKEIRQTPPHEGEVQKIVGRDDDVTNVLNMLFSLHNGKDMSVIAIVGMPGQGKTTLAQLVYENEKVEKHFNKKVWVCVSDNFEIIMLFNKMIQSLTSINPKLSNMERTMKELRIHLQGKRYLLVLDDLRNEIPEKWESMINALQSIGGSRGSKIVVTTHSDIVVSGMQTSIIYRLDRLSSHDSWTIFKQRAFVEGGAVQTSKLVAIGKRMVERCDGRPLAIKALGGLMYYRKEEIEWLSVEKSQMWTSPGEIGLMLTIMLSYSHLPSSSLKYCFSYCAIFPKGSSIEKNDLIQLWMALGLLHSPKGSNLKMEDVGNNYFSTLLWSSLLQDAVRDEYGNIVGCKMHDLVHDLAHRTSKDYCRTSESGERNDRNSVVHLWLINRSGSTLETPRGNLQRLQTLSISCDIFETMSSKLKCLRVLILSGDEAEEIPNSIGNLKNLRYLDISRTGTHGISTSIANLYNLQTLRVKDFLVMPENFNSLTSLRHFYIVDLELSMYWSFVGISQLTSLQTIPLFTVNRKIRCLIAELGGLDDLKGELSIYHLEEVRNMEDARAANLFRKSNVDVLKLVWGGRFRIEESYKDEEEIPYLQDSNEEAREVDEDYNVAVLEGLEPHSNLRCLWIQYFKGRVFASWMMVVSRSAVVLEHLVKIVLKGCKRCERIPTLGHLPTLRDIVIVKMDNVKLIGAEFYNGGAARSIDVADHVLFPALRRLVLKDLPNLKEWEEAPFSFSSVETVFPCLEELIVEKCPVLETAPSRFPCSSIKKLRIWGINDVTALNRVSTNLDSLASFEIGRVQGGQELQSVMEKLLGDSTTSLRSLKIEWCQQLSCLPRNLHGLMALESLRVEFCFGVTSIPLNEVVCGGGLASSLKELRIIWLVNLSCLPKVVLQTTFVSALEILEIRDCHNLVEFPDILRSLMSLRRLVINNCYSLRSIPSGLEDCTSLEVLCITSCSLVESPVPDLRHLTNLYVMWIGTFSNELDYFPWRCDSNYSDSNQYTGSSLRSLYLYGWKGLKSSSSLPDKLQLFSSLTQLSLDRFYEIESLPEWLGNLSALESLHLQDCENLRNLPTVEAMQRLANLKKLSIVRCPHLKRRSAKKIGPDWSKIAHIPQIQIDGEMVQHLLT